MGLDIPKQYVCGFCFDDILDYVVLIEKQKPEWQKGRVNGVGGKVEPFEPVYHAMEREFREETGVLVPVGKWTRFCILHVPGEPGAVINFFYAVTNYITVHTAQTMTDEPVLVRKSTAFYDNYLPNLQWLIPMAKSHHGGKDSAAYFDIAEIGRR